MIGPGFAVLAANACLAVIFFVLSLIKTSLRSLSKVTLRRLAETARPPTSRLIEQFLADPTEFVLQVQSLIQVSLVTIAALVTTAILRSGLQAPVAAAVVGLSLFVLVFEHFFPRYVTSVNRERLLTRLLPAYALLAPVARVLAWPVARLYRVVFRATPGKRANGEVSEEEIRAFIDVGEEAGILDETEGKIVESIVDFSETIVREVMTPRVDIVSIDAGKTLAEARDLILETMHSRLPVYRDRIDNIEGVVYLKDLLLSWRDGRETEKVSAWMKPVHFVPESKSVSSLLKEFQRNRITFAVVVDEFGGISGVVSIEDLIEEILGEIGEEEGAPEVVAEPGGSYLIAGKASIDKLEELFGISVEEADFDTVAGLVSATLGRLPNPGEEFAYGNLRFTVVDTDRHRINQVRVRALPEAAASAEPS